MLAFQSNVKMFWKGCSLVTTLNFSFHHVNRTFKYNLSTTSVSRKRSQNARNKRCGHFTLLDKFLKHTSMDGSLIVKAPLNLRCSASYFDSENKIDTVKNYNVGLSRDEANRIERLNRRKGVYEEDEDSHSIADLAPDNGAGVFMQMEDLNMSIELEGLAQDSLLDPPLLHPGVLQIWNFVGGIWPSLRRGVFLPA